MPVLLGVGGQLAPGQRPRLPAAVKRVIQQAPAADPRPDKTSGLRNIQGHGRNASISGPQHQGHAPAPDAGDSRRSEGQQRAAETPRPGQLLRGAREQVPRPLQRSHRLPQ